MNKTSIGVFSDIHSNYYALKACFDHAVNCCGASVFIFLGDYISDLAMPRETLDLIYKIRSCYRCYFVRGNRERYMLDCKAGKLCFSKDENTGSLFYTYERLDNGDFEFFEGLKFYDQINIDGVAFEIAHSAPDNDRLYFEWEDDYTSEVLKSMKTKNYLTGHTHRQYVHSRDGKTIVNPGSVGESRGKGCVAEYCIIEIEDGQPIFKLQSIDYNLEMTIKSQFERGLVDYAKYWALAVLHDVITGEDYTQNVLKTAQSVAKGDVSVMKDINVWKKVSSDYGMKSDFDGIMEMYKLHNAKKEL